jgi:hypothetical protein
MGMAASQARFLQLTARRSNIEYQGQQINQERLALANASAGLFEKMLTLVPPTPPSSQDDKYYTQGYNFTDPDDELQKKINWSSTTVVAGDFPPDVTSGTDDISISITPVSGSVITMSAASLAAVAAGGTAEGVVGGVVTPGMDMDDIATALGVAMTADQKALGYTQVIRNVTISHNVYNPDGQYATVTKQAPALLEFDNLNRLLNVTLLDKADIDASAGAGTADKPKAIGDGEKLTYSGVFDSVSFEDDMNKYEFQKAAYDYQIERINQQTRQVQSQDKSLELKMKQLDTEHNAVQTEMEAVQKVINKNIESTFKTFA